jgi:L-alanine-DL-glutamate epimerase-like enolase superfamily enzyme
VSGFRPLYSLALSMSKQSDGGPRAVFPAGDVRSPPTLNSAPPPPPPRRRTVLAACIGAPAALVAGCAAPRTAPVARPRPTDMQVVEVSHAFRRFRYRAPYMFGGRQVAETTLLEVSCRIRTGAGHEARGFAAMTLGNAWAFPSVPHEVSLPAMMALAERLGPLTAACDERGHPLDLARVLEPAYLRAAAELSRERALPAPLPPLATLVVGSAFDAALHDGYGKAFGKSAYETYGPAFAGRDLGHYLGPDFRGEHLDRYVPPRPRAATPVFHSIGASDALTPGEVKQPLGDGLPDCFEQWIARDGLTRFKIKLNGGDLAADLARTVAIDRVAARVLPARAAAGDDGGGDWRYCLDFNEGCPDVEYLLEYLRRLREATPAGFARILYIEQPTARDLARDRHNVMHQAARLVPIVVDEGLVSLETLLLARQMGYTGVALKACKGQSQAMLMAAAARKYGLFITVQDLTCPGAALIHSAGIAARVPGNAGIEANARQFVPAANAAWEGRFPGLFTIRGGVMNTGLLTGAGLGAV